MPDGGWAGTILDAVSKKRHEIQEDMFSSKPGREYYAFTLAADPDGKPYMSCESEWTGPHPDQKGWEMRAPSLVNPNAYELAYGRGGYLVVEGPSQLAVWFAYGGVALIEAETAREYLAQDLEPAPSVHDPLGAYRDPATLKGEALRAHPTPKLRMEILKRDHHRCRICGRSADDALDLRLHVHHVRPRALGGLTEPQNLITLCQTCHEGLDPHYEFSLILKAAPLRMPDRADEVASFKRYREAIRQMMDDG
jgi:hypothetical protein